ncbi:MAG: hypothetical protein Tsb0021_11540 [Chlamydiales bacterium]
MLEYNENPAQRIRIENKDLKQIYLKTFKSCDGISGLTPLSGGAVNATYKFMRHGEPFVLRLYIRDPLFCQVENRLIQLLGSRVSIPELIYSDSKGIVFPYAVFRYVEGKHLFEITETSLNSEISFQLGVTLAKIHQIKFEQAGLFDAELRINPVFEEGSSPYYQFVKDHLIDNSIAWNRMGNKLAEKTLLFIDDHKCFFPVVKKGGVLVHSDFKPVNLIWNKGKFTVLDWEFAHSGDGLMDFAILLRHFREFPLDISSLQQGYKQEGYILETDWIKRARITDFVNIVDLLDSPIHRPNLYKALCESLKTTMNNWDQLEKILFKE